jgi:protein-disulfide isomerase
LIERYVKPGRVRLAFENFPLKEHAHAIPAAQAAACAGVQDKFWQMYDLLFSDPRHLEHDHLMHRATQLNLDVAKFDACLTGPQTPRLQVDVTQAARLRVSGVPAFAIGRVFAGAFMKPTARLVGALDLDKFTAALDGVLATAPLQPNVAGAGK